MIKDASVHRRSAKTTGCGSWRRAFAAAACRRPKYDVWMPALGPSEQLLKAVMGGAIEWKEFTRRYHDELFMDGPIDDRSETIKNHGQKSTLRLYARWPRNRT
jgi:uncharacterized protein YeaO (DUF488 family)